MTKIYAPLSWGPMAPLREWMPERSFSTTPRPQPKSPVNWPLRHYPMRSREQARRRALHDRNQAGFQFDDKNWHYQRFREDERALVVPPEKLHRFDGRALSREITWTFYERPSGAKTGR